MERKKVLVLKGKSSFRDKPSRDGEKKSFGFKGKSSFRDKPSRDGEKKSFGFKGKSSICQKKRDQNQLVLQITQSTLEKNSQKIFF